MDQPLLRHGDAELPFDLSREVVASPLVARTHFAAGAPHGSHGDPHPSPRGVAGCKHIGGHSDPGRPEPTGLNKLIIVITLGMINIILITIIINQSS